MLGKRRDDYSVRFRRRGVYFYECGAGLDINQHTQRVLRRRVGGREHLGSGGLEGPNQYHDEFRGLLECHNSSGPSR